MADTQTGYWLPRIQTTLIDEINRRAAATGSVGYAMQTAYANYNGHYVRVYYNDYRKYWLAEYQWGERCVLARGSAIDCLRAGHDYYKCGDKGSVVVTYGPLAPEDIEFAKSLGYVPYDPETEKAQFLDDPRKELISEAFMYEKQLGIPAVSILANAANAEEYKTKMAAFFQARTKNHAGGAR